MPWTNEYGQQVGDPVPGWAARPAPSPVRLEGRYVVLEPLAVDHAADLHATLCNPGDDPLWTYRPTDPPADVPSMVDLVRAHLAAPELVTFAIVPTGERAQGLASYTRIDPATGQVEIAGVLYSRTRSSTSATAGSSGTATA